jgi:group I intron endonuclease
MEIKIKNEQSFNIRRDFGVYLIRCVPENKVYIGSTKQSFRARFSNHCKFLTKGNLSNKLLQEDFNKYGKENFEFEILGVYPENLTVHYERQFIDLFNPYYNINEAYNNSKTNLGKKFSEEHKEKIRQKSKLYKHSSETLELITKQNKEGASQYKITNLKTNEEFIKSYKEVIEMFGKGCNRSFGKIYKKTFKIEQMKKQSKTVSLFVNNEWLEFTSFEKCDKFLNKWRGFTSTQNLRNVEELCGYKVKFIN